MIKLHENVSVNPLNVVSVNLGKDNVYVAMTNARAHRVEPDDPQHLTDVFETIVGELKKLTDCVFIRHDLVATVDGICSIAKVNIGVAVNLANGEVEYIKCKTEDREMIINRLSKEIAQAG